MGIPKFFRWMSERYPGLCKKAREHQLPDTDNFYLDMNGIIHNCTHPCDGDVHFRISEQEMFEDIFNYIDTLFTIIKPKQYFFLAVDGVAPRAKMNQQRSRRFRSAKEASDREAEAIRKGDILPTEERFDSNCITPGTEFMLRLNKALKKFVETKLSFDPNWQKVRVILSGHETPGEGEHKIMDFIRFQRSQPDYDPETRHCLYGLDTDLIMLGLSSHEPNFILLREEIKFNNKRNEPTKGKSQRVDPSKISFNILYLGLLRIYIEKDFLPLKPRLPFKFDLEAIIDDWILICFLVGNDFLPHIPHFHIHKSALPKMFEIYQECLTTMDGYLNIKGFLHMERFRKFAKALSVLDKENYDSLMKQNGNEKIEKLNMFVKQKLRITGIRDDRPKRSPRKRTGHGVHSFSEKEINNSITLCDDGDFVNLSDEEFLSDEKFPGCKNRNKDLPRLGKKNGFIPNKPVRNINDGPLTKNTHKENNFDEYRKMYYKEKLKIEPFPENIMVVVQEYVRALQWNLHYYYHGCISWGWFYPYHYAPLISDVEKFEGVSIKFDMGEPFKPLEQLLSVLPAASSSLLPRVYRPLVSSIDSPLAKYYPTEVEYDLNGKQNDWEAVVLAPFIDEDVLLKASLVYNLFLTEDERKKNVHGPHLVYEFVHARGSKNHKASGFVKCSPIKYDGFHLPIQKIKFGLLVPRKTFKKKKTFPKARQQIVC